MKNMLLLAVVIILLTGCASAQLEKVKTELTGKSKTEILMCAGVPVRSIEVEDVELLTYAGQGGGAFLQPTSYCEATFTLENGAVAALDYTADPIALPQCVHILEKCMVQ